MGHLIYSRVVRPSFNFACSLLWLATKVSNVCVKYRIQPTTCRHMDVFTDLNPIDMFIRVEWVWTVHCLRRLRGWPRSKPERQRVIIKTRMAKDPHLLMTKGQPSYILGKLNSDPVPSVILSLRTQVELKTIG